VVLLFDGITDARGDQQRMAHEDETHDGVKP